MVTKEEFEERYISMSGIDTEFYHKTFLTMTCSCGELGKHGCKGWAAVNNNPVSIKCHKDLYQKGLK